MNYNDSLQVIKGVGEKTEKNFFRLGINTVQELLEHYPRDYEVFKAPIPILHIEEGETVAIEASPTMTPRLRQVRNLKILNVKVKDASGSVFLTWFNMPFLQRTLRMGTYYIFRGKVVRKNGVLVMEQPKIYKKEDYFKKLKLMQPIYPLTKGVTNNAISKSIKEVLKNLDFPKDYIPRELVKEYDLMNQKKHLKRYIFLKTRRL